MFSERLARTLVQENIFSIWSLVIEDCQLVREILPVNVVVEELLLKGCESQIFELLSTYLRFFLGS